MSADQLDMDPATLAALWLGFAGLTWLGWRRLRTGRIHEADGSYTTRAKQPAHFWSAIGVGAFCMLCGYTVLIAATARQFGLF
ncbi:hypothetical protein ACFQ1E_13105 [Sphingomonas canadensis]|uniref:Uncharacterized protein n=1 Tax=Sphingomonas canadensis TaxID=1219257 RepID=A0ABW3H712_9SPHN|nr:hypothetical protein [Sphingomonas canadensis]MCW3837064.1 hypothetical protein [Sphingomonas canadensis]